MSLAMMLVSVLVFAMLVLVLVVIVVLVSVITMTVMLMMVMMPLVLRFYQVELGLLAKYPFESAGLFIPVHIFFQCELRVQ